MVQAYAPLGWFVAYAETGQNDVTTSLEVALLGWSSGFGVHRRHARPNVVQNEMMGRHGALVLYVLALVAVVVGVDVRFFRNRFWQRLMVNVGIVLVFAAFYLRFLRRP
jgi:hypothetical protein